MIWKEVWTSTVLFRPVRLHVCVEWKRQRTCSELLLLQSETLLLMLGHDASLAEQRGERRGGREVSARKQWRNQSRELFHILSRHKNKHVKSHKRLKIKIYNYSHHTHTHYVQITTQKQRWSNGLHDTVHFPAPHDNYDRRYLEVKVSRLFLTWTHRRGFNCRRQHGRWLFQTTASHCCPAVNLPAANKHVFFLSVCVCFFLASRQCSITAATGGLITGFWEKRKQSSRPQS